MVGVRVAYRGALEQGAGSMGVYGEHSQSELQLLMPKSDLPKSKNIVRHTLHIATDSNMKAISMSFVKQFCFLQHRNSRELCGHIGWTEPPAVR